MLKNAILDAEICEDFAEIWNIPALRAKGLHIVELDTRARFALVIKKKSKQLSTKGCVHVIEHDTIETVARSQCPNNIYNTVDLLKSTSHTYVLKWEHRQSAGNVVQSNATTKSYRSDVLDWLQRD